jgi:S-adenosylmethionine hydrolase
VKKPVVLLSDFGTRDGYAAVMRGVILSYDHELVVHDAAHGIRPFSTSSAGYVLHTVLRAFPEGTVFVCVVDPGVGTERNVLLAEVDGRTVVLPDNGTITIAHELADAASYRRVHASVLDELRRQKPAYSSTFDGRDLFAPLGARVAAGGLDSVAGEPATPELVKAHKPVRLECTPGTRLPGTILHLDHFGNAITSLWSGGECRGTIVVEDARLPIHTTFSDAREGEPLAYVGSYGFLEIAVREGSAEEDLGLTTGSTVRLEL